MAFRPYQPAQSPVALFDRAVHLFGQAPSFWLGRGLLPSLPLALLAFAFVHLHQSVWSYEAWDVDLTLRSWFLAGLVVIGLGFRNFAQSDLFGEALAQAKTEMGLAGDASTSPSPLVRRRSCAGAMLGLGCSLMLLPFFLLPGVLFFASTLTLGPLIATEDRDLGSALHRSLRLARSRPLWGAATLLFFGGVHLLVWLSVLLSCGGGLTLISALFGVDFSAAALVLSPQNPSFLFGSGIFAWLLLEPLWLLQRTLLYLDSVLGSSGADLRTRWDAIKAAAPPGRRRAEGGQPSGVAGPLVALGALLFFTLVSTTPGAAQTPPVGDSEAQLISYALRLETLADVVDAALAPGLSAVLGDSVPLQDPQAIEDLRRTIAGERATVLSLPSGLAVRVDLRPGLPPLTDGADSDADLDTLFLLSGRLRAAAAFARALASTVEPMAQPPSNLRGLLAEELSSGDYSVAVRAREQRGEGPPLLGRFFEWLKQWLEGYRPDEVPPPPATNLRLPTKLVVGVALGLFAAFALLLGWFARRRADDSASLPDHVSAAAGPAALPDARSRSVDSWTALAQASARSGNHREAIRELFLAVLAQLELRREIEYRPSASNGEHLATFSGPDRRRDQFVFAVFAFEIAWFGGQPTAGGDWDRMLAHCALLFSPEDMGSSADA